MLDRLYLGDNLLALRKHVASESIDLVYLDPPFNSNAIYKTPAQAQGSITPSQEVEAFSDIWRWDQDASSALDEIDRGDNHRLRALTGALLVMTGRNSMMAYIVTMAVRLMELHRVLKPAGSLYLHSDSSASHYLKLVLDAVFGMASFRREIIWRSGWVSGFKTRTNNWIRNHDTILYYLKSSTDQGTFNKLYSAHSSNYQRRGGGGNPLGKAIDDVWDEAKLYSPNIKSFATEKLGYPTQKPIALLERVIAASSNPGDVVLDPFCGCGTTLDAAQKLGRRWIGIDKTYFAVGLTEKRMRQNYGSALSCETIGVPHDLSTAHRLATDDLDQFRAWLIFRLGAWLAGGLRKSGGAAIDGRFYFVRDGQTKAGVIVIALDPDSQTTVMRRTSSLIAQDGHAMALLVTGTESTEALHKETASHGNTDTDFGKFPKIQAFSLERLFNGETPDLPPFVSPHRRKTRATNQSLAD